MDLNTTTYQEMYNGSIVIIDPEAEWAPPICTQDPTYYKGEIGFTVTGTHKLAQDKPTVTVVIPRDYILSDKRRSDILKRLEYYLRGMEENTSTYKEMYDGKAICITPSTAWDGHGPEPKEIRDNTYWHEDGISSFTVEESNKLSKDVPTVTWQIPCDRIGISEITDTCADFCLRRFKRYIDELNSELYNRSRPDNENGRFYLCDPNGEVLTRNTAYFALCPQKDYENGGGSTVYLLRDGVERPPKMCLCDTPNGSYLVAFCVMGGIFAEGIDLVGDKLIGAVIVGIGIPQLSYEREAIAAYYQDKYEMGKEYAYLYPGMNRVFQAAGRVIRREDDRGVIVLIDDRFRDPLYKKSLPGLWSGVRFIGNPKELKEELEAFWKEG